MAIAYAPIPDEMTVGDLKRTLHEERAPWTQSLPDEAFRECMDELTVLALRSVVSGDFERFEEAFCAWKATAEVYSDPEELRALTTPLPADAFDGPLVHCP